MFSRPRIFSEKFSIETEKNPDAGVRKHKVKIKTVIFTKKLYYIPGIQDKIIQKYKSHEALTVNDRYSFYRLRFVTKNIYDSTKY